MGENRYRAQLIIEEVGKAVIGKEDILKMIMTAILAGGHILIEDIPGTGKTTTLVEAIYETLHREPQVLVCAQRNTAVDAYSLRRTYCLLIWRDLQYMTKNRGVLSISPER